MKIALIANPNAGKARKKEGIPWVEKKLNQKKIKYDLFLTHYHGHTIEIAKRISIMEYDAVVSMGGDGTNYQVLNGVLTRPAKVDLPPFGIIPTGRGNSFSKDLHICNADDGITALLQQTIRRVDVCRFTQDSKSHYFINLMGLGFVTAVARTAARFRWAGGFSYVIGVLCHTLGLTFHQLELDIDGEVISGKNCFIEICNSRFTGGDMLMAPEAQIDDGLFDAVLLSPLSRLSLITTFPKIFKGSHGENFAVRFIKGKSASIHTQPEKGLLPDGEIFGTTPTRVDVLPGHVGYFSLA
ncbi:MAG: diacylglycerol kinase family lipid kinase [Desulfobacterales bacterium]|jgi:YegS/Rv2252/BmrU family lipid kinase